MPIRAQVSETDDYFGEGILTWMVTAFPRSCPLARLATVCRAPLLDMTSHYTNLSQ